MERTKEGFLCRHCGNLHSEQTTTEIKHVEQHHEASITVLNEKEKNRDYVKVQKKCPACGNPEAFRSLFFFSGEHAGTRQERSVENFKCTKCRHTWSES